MSAFFLRLHPWCTIVAAMGLALLGIFEVIDQPTMITLVIVLVVTTSAGCGRASRRGRA
jgi:hypothetical protein